MPLHGEYLPGTNSWSRKQAEIFERTNGSEGNTASGLPVVVLSSLGAKTDKIRKVVVMRVEHEGQYAVVASKGGAPDNPDWYYNLVKNPHVELQDGPVKKDYLAREVTGDDRALWWKRAVEAYPEYGEYSKKITRTIPLFVLTETTTG